VFYRDNCADMALARQDFDAAFIASATGLLISGTHLSQPVPHESCPHGHCGWRALPEHG
jgi:5-dehydro-2-deoxygluconokinase